MMGCLVGGVTTNYPLFDINTQMRLLLLPSDARIGSVIYRLRATDSDRDYPLTFAATDYGSYVIRVDNLPCSKNSSYCEANVFLERSLVPDQLFKFRITVRDTKGDTTTIPVSIKVTNGITDFNEVFPHVPGVVMIPENTKVGTELEYVIVKKNPRSLRHASLELWGSPEFKFQQSSKKDTTTGIITLASSLDYEVKTMYKLSVFATGMWVDPATDSRNIAGFQLVVVVTDVQDTPPVFDPIAPITKLNPNLTVGDVVMRVTARDGDKGFPRPVKYGLVSEGNPFTVFFTIDQDNGDIRLARPLRELNTVSRSHQPILLTVVAEEVIHGSVVDKKAATVALLLDQLDNTPPYFESDKYVTHLAENSVQGTVLVFNELYTTEVRDNDMGKYGVFSLILENNNGTFEISPSVGERQASFIIRVRDNALLDYEERKLVTFQIWAKELNPDHKSLSASAEVIVYITDENDNPPVFQQSNYLADVAENTTAATRLMKFEATDVDTGDAGIIKYTKVLGLKNLSLSLHPDTGILSIATDSHGFDREESSRYQFFIEARDMKGLGNRATVPFILNIIDVNDETPVFEKNPIDFILGPDGTNFSQRAFIKATDADAEAPNNIVRYEIVRGNYGNRYILNAETGELFVNPNSLTRFPRQAKDVVTDLLVRAYDMGVPTLWSTAQVRIFPAESSARVMRFLVPGRNPDRRSVEQLLTDLTGARVVIHSIEPYVPGQNYYARATDLTRGSSDTEKSIVTATILYNNGAIVDLGKVQKHLVENRTVVKVTSTNQVDDTVKVYRSETRALFWILLILILLIALIILLLLLCCFCECCPFYAFFSRLVRKKSAVQAVNTINYMENAGGKENKSVQAEWTSRRREAWSADHPKHQWSFSRRDSGRRLILVPNERQHAPNIIFTREVIFYVGSLERIPRNDNLILEDVDGTEYRVLDPSRLSRPPTRDERFIREGNAEILRLVTRGRDDNEQDDEEPNLNKPERSFIEEEKLEENDGKEDIMRRFIDESNSIKNNEDEETKNNELFKRVMNMDEKEVTTADVNRLTMIQRDLLLTRFLVEERRRVTNHSLIDDTQSLPGVVTMATQTDSHAGTQTDKSFFTKRKTKSDNDDSDSEDNGLRRFKRGVKMRLKEERVVDAFQKRATSRCEIKTPIIEEAEASVENLNSPKPGGHVAPTKTSLLRHAAVRAKIGGDDIEVDNERSNQTFYATRSVSEHDIHTLSTHRENVVRSLQITPVKQLNITNNVLVEHVTHEDDRPLSSLSIQHMPSDNYLSVPQQRPTRSNVINSRPSRKQSISEPPKKSISRDSSQQRSRSRDPSSNRAASRDTSAQRDKDATPRYMEWYKSKRERLEKERKEKKEPAKQEPKKVAKRKAAVRKKNIDRSDAIVSASNEDKDDEKKTTTSVFLESNLNKKSQSLTNTPKNRRKNKESKKKVEEVSLNDSEKLQNVENAIAKQELIVDLPEEKEIEDNKLVTDSGIDKKEENHSTVFNEEVNLRTEEKQRNEDDMDSGIAMHYMIGTELPLRNQRALEKKSIFTIAYDNMETKQIRLNTASPP
ncbi:hypothetical protein O3M35_008483 [Rhynocoris fuscipes]|uniref:Cadherin domain-containing protein n=1 Tax=Rhynocoris fuscipes TaxID=488301 RepID=A0AAW1DDV7_9HEMI